MKSKIITALGFIYVSYAILTAYSALDRLEKVNPPRIAIQEVHKRELPGTIENRRPMDFIDDATYVAIRGEYRIVVWRKDGCSWCDKFERRELPKLYRSGTEIEIKEVGEDDPEEGEKPVRYTPTIKVYRGKILVKEFVGYTKAEDILRYVKYRVVLLK